MVRPPIFLILEMSFKSEIPLIKDAKINGIAISFNKLIKMVPKGLIQSVTLSIRLKDGSEYALEDFYTIDDEVLQKADEQVLAKLSQDGWLLPAYMMLASLSQLQSLIGRRNQSL